MKNLLITNIGNRNILYKYQLIDNKVFRVETERIWQNLEVEKENITVQIIPNHIDSETEKIILVSTSQENPVYNYQDTLYEGKILKKLIEQKYKIPVELEVFDGNPTNENEIFPFFSTFIRRIIKEDNDSKLIFNDAGGTPQMKLVVKELLDYYLTNLRYQIVYSDQNDEKREIDRVYKNKYVLLKTAQKFINEFNYSAALRVLEEVTEGAGISPELIKLVALAAKRMNFETETVIEILKKDPLFQKHFNPFFKHFSQKNPPGDAIRFLQIKPNFQLSIFELASICQLYFDSKNYTLAVATYYRLTEEFFQRFAQSHGQYRLSELKERERFLVENYNDLKTAYTKFQTEQELRSSYGLPTLSLYAFIHANEELKELVQLFMKTISMFRNNTFKGMDLLRNQCFLAHKNNAVTAEMIHKTEPDFISVILPQIFSLLKMPFENVYYTTNRLLNNEFMNN